MIDNLLSQFLLTVFTVSCIATFIFGFVNIGLAFFVSASRDKKEAISENKTYKKPFLSPGVIGLSGIIMILGSLLLGFLVKEVTTKHTNNVIVNEINAKYNVNIYDHNEQKSFSQILDNTPIPVLVHHNGTFYHNTYILTYDPTYDTAKLSLSVNSAIKDNAPTPEELESAAQKHN